MEVVLGGVTTCHLRSLPLRRGWVREPAGVDGHVSSLGPAWLGATWRLRTLSRRVGEAWQRHEHRATWRHRSLPCRGHSLSHVSPRGCSPVHDHVVT